MARESAAPHRSNSMTPQRTLELRYYEPLYTARPVLCHADGMARWHLLRSGRYRRCPLDGHGCNPFAARCVNHA